LPVEDAADDIERPPRSGEVAGTISFFVFLLLLLLPEEK
jgi:hypothetical protein